MSVRLYVVKDQKTEVDYFVCAKNRNAAMNYIAKVAVLTLKCEPATPIQVLHCDAKAVWGETDDLVAIGIVRE